ncbi:hypothetical protein V8G54_000686 [Vigna mungo]|uniref:Uncharacterized protein n=1 Tax=Vigna mungo TaxID=3915 RepID=A0AAQ3S969_VIGMU
MYSLVSSKTIILKGIPIWGAARPTPGAFLMTRIMSSMIFCTFSDFISLGSTSRAGSCRTGSPALTVSGKFVFMVSAPRPKNHPALAVQVWDVGADFRSNGGLAMGIVVNWVAVERQKMEF